MTSAPTASDTSAPAADLTTNASAAADDGPERSSLSDMRLSIGDSLQIDCGTPIGARKAFVKLVGYLKDRSIIVTAPTLDGRKLELIENDSVLVRGFSGMSAYAFRAFVVRVGRIPFDYVHLSFPSVVFGRPVRRSQRVRTDLAAQLIANGPDLNEPTAVNIEDISALGALISSTRELDTKHPMRLAITLVLHANRVEVEVEGKVVSSRSSTAEGVEAQNHRYSLEFKGVDAHDAMLIKAYVYQQIVDCPNSST